MRPDAYAAQQFIHKGQRIAERWRDLYIDEISTAGSDARNFDDHRLAGRTGTVFRHNPVDARDGRGTHGRGGATGVRVLGDEPRRRTRELGQADKCLPSNQGHASR